MLTGTLGEAPCGSPPLLAGERGAADSPMQQQDNGQSTALISFGIYGAGVETVSLGRVTLQGLRDALKEHFGLDAAASDLRVTADPEGITEIPSDEQLFLHIRSHQVLHVHLGRGTIASMEQHIARLRQFQTAAVLRELGQLRLAIECLTSQFRQVQSDMQREQHAREGVEARLVEHQCKVDSDLLQAKMRWQAGDDEVHKSVQELRAKVESSFSALQTKVDEQLASAFSARADGDGPPTYGGADVTVLSKRVQDSEEGLTTLADVTAGLRSEMQAVRVELQSSASQRDALLNLQPLCAQLREDVEAVRAAGCEAAQIQAAELEKEVLQRSAFEREICAKVASLGQGFEECIARTTPPGQLGKHGYSPQEASDKRPGRQSMAMERKLAPGMYAVMCRLERQPELNGKVVRVCEYVETDARWQVALVDGTHGDRRFNLKPENLEPCTSSADPREDQPQQQEDGEELPSSPVGRPHSFSPGGGSQHSRARISASESSPPPAAPQRQHHGAAGGASPVSFSPPPPASAAASPARLGVMMAPVVLPPEATVDQAMSRGFDSADAAGGQATPPLMSQDFGAYAHAQTRKLSASPLPSSPPPQQAAAAAASVLRGGLPEAWQPAPMEWTSASSSFQAAGAQAFGSSASTPGLIARQASDGALQGSLGSRSRWQPAESHFLSSSVSGCRVGMPQSLQAETLGEPELPTAPPTPSGNIGVRLSSLPCGPSSAALAAVSALRSDSLPSSARTRHPSESVTSQHHLGGTSHGVEQSWQYSQVAQPARPSEVSVSRAQCSPQSRFQWPQQPDQVVVTTAPEGITRAPSAVRPGMTRTVGPW
mmetsp:Transcript_58177/g.138512  ORF Transcript_58177/g.138512 Transcript_58177/m.138512 type:complete len:830 (+) Transcript_58177:70-2559(+)